MSYDFMMLSPSDFESLVCDVLSKYLNIRLESFKPGKDKGIDLRHSLSLKGKNDMIIQCKRYAPHKINDLKRDLKKNELPKVIKLSPSRYLIATSVALSAENKKSIVSDLSPWILSNGDVFGPEDLNKLLRNYPEVERSHFKLWISSSAVLERILNAKVLSQTAATIDEIKNDASKFVMHSGFNKALEVMSEKHHILIVGNPGIGKTTLAKMIMCHYIEDGFEPISIMNNIDDVWSLIHSDGISERRLVILYDDFLGRVQFNADKFGKNEDRSLLSLLDLVSRNNNIRLILTTREYILEDAKRLHGSFESRADEILRYSLSLEIYAKRERASILFNHLFFSNLPNERLQCLVETKAYLDVLNHKGFNPRIVQIVSDYANSKAMNNEEFIEFFKREFDNPAKLWEHPFRREISPVARKLLLVLWTFNGQSELDNLENAVASYVNPTDHYDFKNLFNDALKQLEGNFVSTERLRGGSFKKKTTSLLNFRTLLWKSLFSLLYTNQIYYRI
ncbi:restriction endonuclease [Pantoea trifolii]|uniref:nSTAND3 domain-containing NTPase n=1 Tax=Pantoea trifolii TaxID=2968030 RepID=UPI003EDA9A76